MTIRQRKRQDSVTKRKSFMISDEQEAKKHEAAQMLLFQMSDVQGELYKKKQQAASRKECAAEQQQKKKRICAEAYDQPHIKCTQINKRIEEAAFANREIVQDSIKEGEDVNAEFNQLLMLANSAELLESEGQYDLHQSLNGPRQIDDVEVEKGAFRIQGKVRLIHIRQRARLGNLQRGRTDFGRLEDTHGGKSVEVDQVQGVMHHQNVQDPCVVTRGSEDIEGIRKHTSVLEHMTTNTDNLQQLSVNEPMNLNNRTLQKSSARTHLIVPPPVERDPEICDLGENNGVHPLTEVGTAKTSPSNDNKLSENIEVGTAKMSCSNDKKIGENLQRPALEHPVPVQMYSELEHCREQHSSAHQLKNVRMAENLQQPSVEPHVSIPQPVQMTPELGDCTQQESVADLLSRMSSLLNKSLNTEKELGHALNNLTECSSSLIQKSKVVKKCDYPARYKGKSKRPPVVWLSDSLKDDPSIARHRRMLRSIKRIAKRKKRSVQKSEGLNNSPSVARDRRMLRISKQRKKAVQRISELGEIKERDSGSQPLMEVETSGLSNPEECFLCENLQKAAAGLHAFIPQGVQMASDFGDLREKQNSAQQMTEVRTQQISLSKKNNLNENLQQPFAEPHVSIPLPVQMTAELGDCREKNSSAHLLTAVETSKMSPLIKKNLDPQQVHGHPSLDNSTECSPSLKQMSEVLKDSDSTVRRKGRRKRLSVVQKSEDLKDDPSITRHRRTLRIIERRKQRHDAEFLSIANIHMRPVCQGQHWGMWRFLNAQQYEQTHIAKQHCPSNVSYSQPKRAERIEDQRALEASLQQSNIPQPMEQSHLEEWLHDPKMAPSEEQASVLVEVNQSLQHHCISEVCEDHSYELQQQMTNVGDENRTSSIKQKMRLTRLKHEARLKHSPLQLKN